VVFAGVVGWIVLGEAIAPIGLLGAALILGGIVLVRLEPGTAAAGVEPLPATGSVAVVPAAEVAPPAP
jgi:hypothetical protein